MLYCKPALTFEQQADQLIARGLTGDRATIISRPSSVNYYRLSAYWLPFRVRPETPSPYPLPQRGRGALGCTLTRQTGSDNFRDGASISEVWDRYVFDRRLRLLAMDAIERIEIAVRTHLVYGHAHKYGAFGYTDPKSLPELDGKKLSDFYKHIQEEVERAKAKEQFVQHFYSNYGSHHQHLPVWMITEVMTFGTVLRFFNAVSPEIRQNVASVFDMHEKVLGSWLLTFNMIRNICAHHARLWNRWLGLKPMIPRQRKHPDWHSPTTVQNNRVFGVLTIFRYCVRRIAPQSSWADRLKELLAAYPAVPIAEMGFPPNWQSSPIWSN